MSDLYPTTEATALRRKPERGSHQRAVVNRILDEGLVCHVGWVRAGRPVVIPTLYARVGETLYPPWLARQFDAPRGERVGDVCHRHPG